MTKATSFKLPIIETLYLSALFLFVLVLEAELAISMSWHFFFFMAAWTLLIVTPQLFMRNRKNAFVLFATFNLLLLSLHFLAFNALKPFTRFRHDITVGMTTADVQRAFMKHFPPGGRFRQPVLVKAEGARVLWPFEPAEKFAWSQMKGTPDQTLHYTLDPDDGRFNSEWLIVYLKDGRVLGTEYLPD